MALSGKRILVTGGAGFIGTTLARQLSADNEVVLYDNLHRNALAGTELEGEVELIQGDVLDADALTSALEGMTHLVHAAGIAGVDTVLGSPVTTMRVNVVGTYNALEAALANRETIERVVEFSTSEVFGQHAFNVSEGHVTTIGSVGEARWTYAVSKLAGEHMSHAYHSELGLPTVSVRPFNVYGPGQIGGGAIRAFIEAALAGRDLTIHGDGSQIRAWTYVEDMVRGVLLALEHPNAVGESFNIGNPRSAVTIFDLAQRIKRLSGCSGEITFQPLHYVDVELRIPNADKARELLGFDAGGRAGRRPRAHDRLVPRATGNGNRVSAHRADSARTAGRRRGGARGGRGGDRLRDADDGSEGRRVRACDRGCGRDPGRRRGVVRDRSAPSRARRPRCRAGRRGDRPGVHVPRDRERRRALRRAHGVRRRRPDDIPRRRRRGRRGGHRADEGGDGRPSLRRPVDWDGLRAAIPERIAPRRGRRRRARGGVPRAQVRLAGHRRLPVVPSAQDRHHG